MAGTLIDELTITKGDLVSLVGAGGKTTIALRLVDEALRRGWRVVFTTTTRIGDSHHGGHPVARPDDAMDVVDRKGVCVVGDPVGQGKLAGPGLDWIDAARDRVDLLVVEADGARGMRAKAPEPHEPVIPLSTDVVVAVIAADGIDRVIEDACHRPLRVGAVVGASPYDRLTPERASILLTSGDGGRKSVPPHARFVVAITKVDAYESERVGRLVELLNPVPVVEIPYEPVVAQQSWRDIP